MMQAVIVTKISEGIDRYCIGETNVTYERYVFNQRVQQPGESMDDFVVDLRKLAKPVSSIRWRIRLFEIISRSAFVNHSCEVRTL